MSEPRDRLSFRVFADDLTVTDETAHREAMRLFFQNHSPRARMLLRVMPKRHCRVQIGSDRVILCRPFEGNKWSFVTIFPPPIDPEHFIVPAELASRARQTLIDAGPWR
jgi:hypothetical protein